jgi:tRNA G18 (ribose-2'-O)-methylase SpoU
VVIHVSSASDVRLDDYRNIPDPELLRDRGIFIAEGRHVVRRLLASSRFPTRSLLLTPAAFDALADALPGPDIPVFVVSQAEMTAVAGFNIHRGCLAIGERPRAVPWENVVSGASRVVVLEQVSNADNVGGIFRNAAAFGTGAVLLGPCCADPLYRKAVRTSMGAAVRVPFAAMPEWPRDLAALHAAGFTLVALTPDRDAPPLTRLDGRVALLLGHEGDGLSAAALAHADMRARIPLAEGVDSLNVASAAAVGLYVLRGGEFTGRSGRSGN